MSQLFLFCGHVYRGAHLGVRKTRRCIVERDHFGSHFDGEIHWTVGCRWANWRGGKAVT